MAALLMPPIHTVLSSNSLQAAIDQSRGLRRIDARSLAAVFMLAMILPVISYDKRPAHRRSAV